MSYKRFKQEANLIFKYSTSGRLLVICKQEGQLVRNLRIYKEFHNATRALEHWSWTKGIRLQFTASYVSFSLRYKSACDINLMISSYLLTFRSHQISVHVMSCKLWLFG